MRRYRIAAFTLALILMLCWGMPALSQTSVGFENPENIQPVLDYRLPSWGYTKASLAFHLSGWGRNAWGGLHRDETTGKFELSPKLTWYHENESRVRFLDFYLNGRWSGEYRDRDGGENESKRLYLRYGAEALWDQYFRPNVFFSIGGRVEGSHSEDTFEGSSVTEPDYRRIFVSRRTRASANLGLGFGRLRDVTPSIQALRFAERFRVLDKGRVMSPGEIQSIAGVLTAGSSYAQVYDRPSRRLWQALIDCIDGVETLTPFETYYLADVMRENVGRRLEGWDLRLGFRFTQSAGSHAFDDQTIWAGAMDGRWYRNLNLDHQIGLEVSLDNDFMVAGDLNGAAEGEFRAVAKHLWVIADRVSWESKLKANIIFGRHEDRSESAGEWWSFHTHKLKGDLLYYIEDRFEIVTGAELLTSSATDTSGDPYGQVQWSLYASIRYHITRSLH